MRRTTACIAIAALAACLLGCVPGAGPGTRLDRCGDEIIVCGQLFHTGTPVVTWLDPGGYDAYRVHRKFEPTATLPAKPTEGTNSPNRYGSWRTPLPAELEEAVKTRGWKLEELQQIVDQFVIHYDACGNSRQCFKILHDMRGLSVQFMLDVDGTIYQTLDLKERAWHAGTANSRSIGVEIAHIGAYKDLGTPDQWCQPDESGQRRVVWPSWMGDGGVRTPDFVGRPARPDPIWGNIQNRELVQYDFTNEQYEALIKLTATLCRVFPKVVCDAPRDEHGAVISHVLSAEQLRAYQGLLGHYHITTQKIDPGPAFDWFRVLNGARRHLRQWPLPQPTTPAAEPMIACDPTREQEASS